MLNFAQQTADDLMWQLCVLLYMALTKRHPFVAQVAQVTRDDDLRENIL